MLLLAKNDPDAVLASIQNNEFNAYTERNEDGVTIWHIFAIYHPKILYDAVKNKLFDPACIIDKKGNSVWHCMIAKHPEYIGKAFVNGLLCSESYGRKLKYTYLEFLHDFKNIFDQVIRDANRIEYLFYAARKNIFNPAALLLWSKEQINGNTPLYNKKKDMIDTFCRVSLAALSLEIDPTTIADISTNEEGQKVFKNELNNDLLGVPFPTSLSQILALKSPRFLVKKIIDDDLNLDKQAWEILSILRADVLREPVSHDKIPIKDEIFIPQEPSFWHYMAYKNPRLLLEAMKDELFDPQYVRDKSLFTVFHYLAVYNPEFLFEVQDKIIFELDFIRGGPYFSSVWSNLAYFYPELLVQAIREGRCNPLNCIDALGDTLYHYLVSPMTQPKYVMQMVDDERFNACEVKNLKGETVWHRLSIFYPEVVLDAIESKKIDAGKVLNVRNDSVIHYLAAHNPQVILEGIASKKFDLSLQDIDGATVLHYLASIHGDLFYRFIVNNRTILLSEGQSLEGSDNNSYVRTIEDIKDAYYRLVLYRAGISEEDESVETCCFTMSDIYNINQARDNKGQSIWHYMAKQHPQQLLMAVRNKLFNSDENRDIDGNTVWHCLAFKHPLALLEAVENNLFSHSEIVNVLGNQVWIYFAQFHPEFFLQAIAKKMFDPNLTTNKCEQNVWTVYSSRNFGIHYSEPITTDMEGFYEYANKHGDCKFKLVVLMDILSRNQSEESLPGPYLDEICALFKEALYDADNAGKFIELLNSDLNEKLVYCFFHLQMKDFLDLYCVAILQLSSTCDAPSKNLIGPLLWHLNKTLPDEFPKFNSLLKFLDSDEPCLEDCLDKYAINRYVKLENEVVHQTLQGNDEEDKLDSPSDKMVHKFRAG